MARTIIVGDVHGCRDELDRLLDHVGLTRSDRLFLVGDTVARGPDPCGVLEILRHARGLAVRGNHEDRLLRWRASGAPDTALGSAHRATARALRKKDWTLLDGFPLWLDLPEHDARIVHAGIIPGMPIEAQSPRVLMNIRGIGPRGEAIEQRGREPWGTRYEGPLHLIFGHNAQADVQIHPFATGIDTGAVYGGRLTALVLREGELVPNVSQRREALVSVPARKAYFPR